MLLAGVGRCNRRRQANNATHSDALANGERQWLSVADVLDIPIERLRRATFTLADLSHPMYNLQVRSLPVEGRQYVIGADFALGVEGGDFDAACVLDLTHYLETGQDYQVAELSCRMGVSFYKPLYALCRMYNNAFLLGEQQGGGLSVMRMMWDELHYRHIYTHVDPNKAMPEQSSNPRLGWPAQEDDITVHNLRLAVAEDKIDLFSMPLLEQMSSLQYVAPKTTDYRRQGDNKLQIKVPGGGSPDLMRACAYALHARQKAVVLPNVAPVRQHASTFFLPDAKPVEPVAFEVLA